MIDCQQEGFWLIDVKKVSEDKISSEISLKDIGAGVKVTILSE